MDIEIKSIGELIDQLCTTSQKCFSKQDELMVCSDDDIKAIKIAKDIQHLNKRRNDLVQAINRRLHEEDISTLDKTYK
jgi:hypothetical protein